MAAAKGSARTPLGPKLPKIVVYLSSSAGRIHFARTNYMYSLQPILHGQWNIVYKIYQKIVIKEPQKHILSRQETLTTVTFLAECPTTRPRVCPLH